jgi:hypothetical protein
MNNDTLINQARRLYAVLHIERYALSIENKTRLDRLDHIIMRAYSRYQRRLNRCVLCYQHRLHRCIRELKTKETRFCPASFNHSIGQH